MPTSDRLFVAAAFDDGSAALWSCDLSKVTFCQQPCVFFAPRVIAWYPRFSSSFEVLNLENARGPSSVAMER